MILEAVLFVLLAQQPVLKLPSEVPASATEGPSNLDFETGEAGQVPHQWALMQLSRIAGYSTEWRKKGCRTGSGCAVIVAGPQVEKNSSGAVMQYFPAEPYEAKRMRLRAWVRLEDGRKGDRIKVAFTADGQDANATFTQKGRGVDSAEWTMAEVEGKVPWHAEIIHILVSVSGKGTAWIDDVTFEPVK